MILSLSCLSIKIALDSNQLLNHFVQYSSLQEEQAKYEQFKKSLIEVDRRNRMEQESGGSAVFGITVFSDMSTDTFKSQYLGTELTDEYDRELVESAAIVRSNITRSNWIGVLTTPIKTQGSCGSCW